VSNATQYDVYLLQAPWGWGDIKYSATSWGTTHTFTNVTSGDYRAFVITRPNVDSVQSNWVSFKVSSSALPSTSANIPDGIYAIQNKGSGKYVDVSSVGTGNGQNVHIWDWANGQNQVFSFERQSDNTYMIRAIHSNKVLDVSGVSTSTGATVHQWEWGGGNNQRWYVVDCGGGYYKFIAKHSGKALDVSGGGKAPNGTNVQQWDDNGSDAQRFKLITDRTTVPSGLTNASSKIVGKVISLKFTANGKFAMADLSTSGASIQARTTVAQSWEKFEVVSAPGGFVGLRNIESKKFLTVNPNNRPAKLAVNAPNLLEWEYFQIYQVGSTYYLRSAINGYWVYANIGETYAPLRANGPRPGGWEPFSISIY
jgi:hypothetical protein